MTDETIQKINRYCNQYGDKLLELMEKCHVPNTPSVPEDKALIFLKELEEQYDKTDLSENYRCRL